MSIVVTINSKGTELQNTCSGTILSPTVVFTCNHVFDLNDDESIEKIEIFYTAEEFLERRNGQRASLVPLPESIQCLFDESLNRADLLGYCNHRTIVDLAVLKLNRLLPRSHRNFLRIPMDTTIPNPLYNYGELACALGMPAEDF